MHSSYFPRPVPVPQPKGDPVTVHSDEGPRADTTLERLSHLRPAFREGGSVTRILCYHDVVAVSRKETALSDSTRQALAAIPDPIHVQVFVTPT